MPLSPALSKAARAALAELMPGRMVAGLSPLGRGHINYTLLVTFADGEPRRGVLQRLNRLVFPEPEKIMANLEVLAAHLAAMLAKEHPSGGADLRMVVRPLGGIGNQRYFRDRDGHCWRLISHVDNAVHLESLDTRDRAREAGRGLGIFHRLVAGLDPARLADTLPGFHVTPHYLADYDRLVAAGCVGSGLPGENRCRVIIETRREMAGVLEEAAGRGLIRPRVIHGDPRLANMLFDTDSGRVVALIDLDTVQPGLLHYDLGDLLRSCCNPVGDDPANPESARFDLDICRQVLGGYLSEAGRTLTASDYELIYPAVRLLAFELGLRFFSDHLAGNVYFRCTRPDHNLQRALAQFRLLAGIEERETQIHRLVEELRLDSGE